MNDQKDKKDKNTDTEKILLYFLSPEEAPEVPNPER